MQTTVPLYGFGSGGGTGAALVVTAPAGVTVTISKDGKTKTKTADASGFAVFKGLRSGAWTVTITDGAQTSSKIVTIQADYAVAISFNTIPEFTYTGGPGSFEIVSDADEPITTSQGDWKIRFLTSGTLTFTNLNGADAGIDVFCVGGGGGGKTFSTTNVGPGGGGGYTATGRGISVEVGVPYQIEIGAGGSGAKIYTEASLDGGSTSAFGITANGGKGIPAGGVPAGGKGGDGGSGGASIVPNANVPLSGGTDGGDGGAYGTYKGGVGQGTTTREFGAPSGRLYASGGSCKSTAAGDNGADNTGDGGGGGGGSNYGGKGGSGIVIIRNAREVA